MALGRVLVAVALDAHERVVPGGKGPIDQGAAALVAEEAVAVPVAILVRQVLHRETLQLLWPAQTLHTLQNEDKHSVVPCSCS